MMVCTKLIILLLPHQHQLWLILPYICQLCVISNQQGFQENLMLQISSLLFENVLSTLISILISSKADMFDVKTFELTREEKWKN